MRIGKSASSAEYRIDEQFQNCQFSEPNFDFPNWKNSRNFLILLFGQFKKLQIWKIRKIFDSANSRKKNQFENFQEFVIWKIYKICNMKNSKNLQFLKF